MEVRCCEIASEAMFRPNATSPHINLLPVTLMNLATKPLASHVR